MNTWQDAYKVLEQYTNLGKIDTAYALEIIAQRLREAELEQERLKDLSDDSADAVDDIGDAADDLTNSLYGSAAAAAALAGELSEAQRQAQLLAATKASDDFYANSGFTSSRYMEEYGVQNKDVSGTSHMLLEAHNSGRTTPVERKTTYDEEGKATLWEKDINGNWKIRRSHSGEPVVTKETTPLDSFLGLRPDETLRILKVGEGVLTPEQNEERLKMNLDGYNNTVSEKTSSMSNSHNYSNDSSVSISIGDIVVNGNADSSTIASLKKAREELIQDVFKRIQGHSITSGYRNAKNFAL